MDWSSRDVQKNPSGFRKAQREERERAGKERREAEQQSDFASFKRLFEERGGDPKDARKYYDHYRSLGAVVEATELDQRARNAHRVERIRQV